MTFKTKFKPTQFFQAFVPYKKRSYLVHRRRGFTKLAPFLLFLSLGVLVSDIATSSEVDKYWLKLLHYHSNRFTSGYRSEIVGSSFFSHPKGKTNPELELEESISILQTAEWKKFACKFPARFKYLKQNYSNRFSQNFLAEEVSCEDFDKWKKNLTGSSISLVFSSPYSGNPASLFGHTLLKFNQHPPEDKALNLLNYSSNFAAIVPDDENGILYAIYGLFGGYTGAFSLGRFYEKVSEYALSENRDLWEYELNFNSQEIDFLVSHLWELYHQGEFQYFFLDRNCSYQLLALLEIARPSLDLQVQTEYRNAPYVLPVDTLKKVLEKKELLKKVHFISSAHRQLTLEISNLTEDELEIWIALVQSESKIELQKILDTNINISTRAIFAAATYFQYYRMATLNKEGKSNFDEQLRLMQLKIASLKIDVKSSEVLEPQYSRPENSHRSFLFAPGLGVYNGLPAGNVRFRLGFHDYSNADAGFDKGAQNQLLDGQLSIRKKDLGSEFQLDELTLFRLTSVVPLSLIKTTFSYDFFSQWKWDEWQNRAALGLGFSFYDSRIIVFPNLFFNINWRNEIAWSTGIGSSLIGMMNFTNQSRLYLELEVQNRINKIYSFSRINSVFSHTVTKDREVAIHWDINTGSRILDEQRLWLSYRFFY